MRPAPVPETPAVVDEAVDKAPEPQRQVPETPAVDDEAVDEAPGTPGTPVMSNDPDAHVGEMSDSVLTQPYCKSDVEEDDEEENVEEDAVSVAAPRPR